MEKESMLSLIRQYTKENSKMDFWMEKEAF